MTATLRWNRLSIAADGDAQFKADIEARLDEWAALPHAELEVDLGQCTNLTDESFKVAAPRLADTAAKKRLVVRAGAALARQLEAAGFGSSVELRIVMRMGPGARLSFADFDGVPPEGEDEAEPEAALEPAEDGAEPVAAPHKDATIPPSGDVNITKVQVKASNGQLVDQEDGKRYPVGEELSIGREPPATVVFQIPTISKKHFRIYLQGPAYFIEDLRSTNGTYLNGDPLTQPRPLAEGDEIVVAITLKHPDGARRFKFSMK
ncbi:MAG: FHA domain-containing protein [Planctomycetes bacterium]|nr:FHA domain-containing protein [Planctomycetota bacterium]